MRKTYSLLTLAFLALGLVFSIILSYNYFLPKESISLFCPEDSSYLDCKKVSRGEYSAIFGIPISIFGLAFYIAVIFYYTFPFLNPKREHFLKVPFLFILLIANIIDIALLLFSLFVIKAFCTQCAITYLANLGLLLVFYFKEFRRKVILDEISNFLSSFKKDYRYRKELVIYLCICFLFFFLLSLFSINKKLRYSLLDMSHTPSAERVNEDNENLITPVGLEDELKEFYEKSPSFTNKFKLPYFGNKNAPIEILVFHDLQCPICQISFAEMEETFAEYSPLVKISYFNLPFKKSSKHSQLNSFQLASYSWFAFSRNKYHDFLSSLFRYFGKGIYIDKAIIKEIFEQINIKDDFAIIDRQSYALSLEIRMQQEAARNFFIRIKSKSMGTPAFFINGRFLGIGYKKDLIERIVKEEILQFAKKSAR